MDILCLLYLWDIQLTSKPARLEENTAYLQNLLVISHPSVLKILKLAVLLRSYERFSTGKMNSNGLFRSVCMTKGVERTYSIHMDVWS